MAIQYNESTRTFHLYNDQISYVIRIMENDQPEQIYYGRRISEEASYDLYHEEAFRALMSVCVPEPGILSLHFAKQEYPCYGTGDYRSPAFSILQENGSRVTEFRYVSHRITDGKPSLLPLPATYVEDPSEAQTLEITLRDELIGTELVLIYTIYEAYPVITRSARFEHKGGAPVILERAMSMSVEWSDMSFDMITLEGSWARERYVKERKLEMGIQSIGGVTGTASSAEHNPFLALARPGCTEEQGEVYGFSLVYSGNFLAQTEVSTFDMTRVMMGIHPDGFSWRLQAGDSFQTPEAVMVYSGEGLGGMSRTFHRLYRTRLMRGEWRDKPRPILLNNWEATYFNFSEEKLLEIAAGAKDCGIELFVLDDGWFGQRTNDRRGLGDWVCNLDKIPSGIDGLSRKVEAMGLQFGLWVELEMVNEDSDLFRSHPEWVIGAPDRFRCLGRHQYVLDYSNPDVVEYIYEMIAKILSTSKISYIKWDMNRYMTGAFSNAAWVQGGGAGAAGGVDGFGPGSGAGAAGGVDGFGPGSGAGAAGGVDGFAPGGGAGVAGGVDGFGPGSGAGAAGGVGGFAPGGGAGAAGGRDIWQPLRQGEMMHRYILGVYTLYEKLTSAFPHILFESCASGGARFDAGMMFWAPQAWCSDDSDAAERQKIQYGTSYVYPIVSMGSHVSAVPNHQLMRTTPLDTRANVAYFGTFGYELDLNLLTEEELEKVREQVRFMKKNRELIQVDGDFYRLRNPFKGNEAAWMVVSRDKRRAIAAFYQRLNKVNGSWERLRLQGLDPDKLYEVKYDASLKSDLPPIVLLMYGIKPDDATQRTLRLHGSTLMYAGIPISRQLLALRGGDFTSILFEIEEVE